MKLDHASSACSVQSLNATVHTADSADPVGSSGDLNLFARAAHGLPPTTAQRFWSKVDKSGECWIWTGRTSRGYGALSMQRRSVYAHRLSYEIANGPIPAGMCVCHRCDNPPCVRPDHLFLGTYADNNRDRDAKGRHVPLVGERSGTAKLTDADVRLIHGRLFAGEPMRLIARDFGVSKTTIEQIRVGRVWRHLAPADLAALPRQARPIADAVVREIARRLVAGDRAVDIARAYGVTQVQVSNIRHRRAWRSAMEVSS